MKWERAAWRRCADVMLSLLLVFVSVCPLSAEPQKSGDCVNTWSKGVVGGACVATSPVDVSYSSLSSLPTNSPPVALRHKHATHVDTYMHKSVITDDVWCTDLQAVCTPAYQKMAASVSLNNFEYNIFQTSYTAVVSHTHTHTRSAEVALIFLMPVWQQQQSSSICPSREYRREQRPPVWGMWETIRGWKSGNKTSIQNWWKGSWKREKEQLEGQSAARCLLET